jgi:hypothetical protein
MQQGKQTLEYFDESRRVRASELSCSRIEIIAQAPADHQAAAKIEHKRELNTTIS